MAESSTEVPYERQNVHKGHRYIKNGNMIAPCPWSLNALDLDLQDNQEVIAVLNKQMGRLVLEWDSSWITKSGAGVRPPEAEAMSLVFRQTDVPAPEVLFTDFSPDEGKTNPKEYFKPDYRPSEGVIGMTIISGITLEQKWDSLEDEAKESSCLQLWDLITKIRTIPRSQEVEGPYQCAADGSLSRDPMLEDLQEPARPILSDSDLRARIYERYLYHGGSRYENRLLDMLPHSERSVFTHADIAPRNILVDEENNVTGVIDWEYAGWYPEYWEYAQIMRPAFWGDWSVWMDKTAPQRWDLGGINAARKVLF